MLRTVCAVHLAVLKVHLKHLIRLVLPKLNYNHLKLCCHHRYAFHYRLTHDCHISPYITCQYVKKFYPNPCVY